MTENDTHDAVVIERIFDASVERIWQMWTDPAHFAAWYGPDGATIPVAEMDLRVGGARRVAMEVNTPNGPMRMWFAGEFRVIVRNELLVYSEWMTDEHGTVLSPAELGMPDGHPTTTEVRVEISAIGARTKMVMTHLGVPAGSPGAAGWGMALDKLDARVRQMSADQR